MPLGAVDFAYRKRLDGNSTIAVHNLNLPSITPDHLRLFKEFAPLYVTIWRELSFCFNASFIQELATKSKCRPDEQTIFEQCRVMVRWQILASSARSCAT